MTERVLQYRPEPFSSILLLPRTMLRVAVAYTTRDMACFYCIRASLKPPTAFMSTGILIIFSSDGENGGRSLRGRHF